LQDIREGEGGKMEKEAKKEREMMNTKYSDQIAASQSSAASSTGGSSATVHVI
jgi:hypothetical protein